MSGGSDPRKPGLQKSDYRISAETSVGINAQQLRARLYATSEIHTNARPQLKATRRRSNTDVSLMLYS